MAIWVYISVYIYEYIWFYLLYIYILYYDIYFIIVNSKCIYVLEYFIFTSIYKIELCITYSKTSIYLSVYTLYYVWDGVYMSSIHPFIVVIRIIVLLCQRSIGWQAEMRLAALLSSMSRVQLDHESKHPLRRLPGGLKVVPGPTGGLLSERSAFGMAKT